MNVELIDKVIAVIEQNPVNFSMSEWIGYKALLDKHYLEVQSEDVFDCGSTCCIAGWAVILGKGSLVEGGISEKALDLMDLPNEMWDIFYADLWPTRAWFEAEGVDMDKPEKEREVAQAIALLRAIRNGRKPWGEAVRSWHPTAANVSRHVGQYEEDRGR